MRNRIIMRSISRLWPLLSGAGGATLLTAACQGVLGIDEPTHRLEDGEGTGGASTGDASNAGGASDGSSSGGSGETGGACTDGGCEGGDGAVATGGAGGTSANDAATGGSTGAIVPECAGKQPGDIVCQGMDRLSCGPNLTTTTSVDTCTAGAQTCSDGACVDCAGQTANCDLVGSDCEVELTSAQSCGTSCSDLETCEAGEVCSSGKCSPPSCAGLSSSCGATSNEGCCDTLEVRGGTFLRNYDGVIETNSTHRGWVSDFRLDRFEVTVGRFRKFVAAWNAGYRPSAGSGKHSHLNGGSGLVDSSGTTTHEQGWQTAWSGNVMPTDTNLTTSCDTAWLTWTASPGIQEDRPMVCANWYEAQAFCIWDGGFLPSEMEWNYAGSGGDEQRVYPWSSPPSSSLVDCTYANSYDGAYCAATGQNDVGSQSPKGDGRYGQADLWGNVQEWQLDGYNASLPATCRDCAHLGTATLKVSGGGCFDCGPGSVQSHAGTYGAIDRNRGTGFRCARPPLSCSANLETDPQNCGHCGHSCLGGACSLGECQPVTLATGQAATQMALTATNLYWGNTTPGDGVMTIPITGGAVTPVVTGEHAAGIVLDSTNVYFSSDFGGGAIRKAPLGGGAAQTVVSTVSPGPLVANSTNVFWTAASPAGLNTALLVGGSATNLSATAAYYLARSDSRIFFPAGATVSSIPFGGGTPTPVITGQSNAYGIAVDGNEMFWTNLTNFGDNVAKAALDGSNPVVLAKGRPGPQTITADAARVYWTENGITPGGSSALVTVPRVGGSATVLASWPRDTVGMAANVIVDADAVYWNLSNGTVYKMAKP